MSAPYYFGDPSAGDPSESNYSVYDPRFAPGFRVQTGTSSHFDGAGFWYRSEGSESIYDSVSGSYGRSKPMIMAENIKHRRTRSGCFTCRSRRVKCDETRPVCDRCRKGSRQCDFPPPTSNAPSKRLKYRDSPSKETSIAEVQRTKDDGEPITLKTIKDESEEEDSESVVSPTRPKLSKIRTHSTQSLNRKQKYRQQSEGSSVSREKATSPSTETSSSVSRSETPLSSLQANSNSNAAQKALRQSRWAHSRLDVQKYLQFHEEHVTSYHYFFKVDADDFTHGKLVDVAMSYEPLLYAIVAFSAYQHTVRQPDGQLSDFLGYYTKAMNLLRKSLEKGSTPTEATLLTVLQLATFEEYLGDWVSLSGHHRAAHYMLLDLYNAETIMETEVQRQILSWYARFDVIAGLMAGNETTLSREWYSVCADWFEEHIDPGEVDVDNSFNYIVAINRLIGIDIATLFSKLPRGTISMETFMSENTKITDSLQLLKRRIESLNDGYWTVTEFSYRVPLTADDIVNPYVPGGLFRGVYWPLNYLWIDWYGLYQMHTYQTSIALQQKIPPELETISLEQCRIYEAIDRWPDAPAGSLLGAHASLALAAVFLQKDERHSMWARRKLADVERLGYVFPLTFRQKMAEMWRVPETESWWLPNEEGYLPILREVRKLIREREKAAAGGKGGDLRDIKAIFSKLNIEGGGASGAGSESSPESVPSVSAEAGFTPPSAVAGQGRSQSQNLEQGGQGTSSTTTNRRRSGEGSRSQSQVLADRMSWVGEDSLS